MKFSVFYFLFFLSSNDLFSQNKNFFKKVVEKGNLIQFCKENKRDYNFIGNIKDSSNNTLYYVITFIEIVKANQVYHGHNIVFILDPKYNVLRRFEIGLPSELPFKLEANVLYFHYVDENEKNIIYQNNIGNVIPSVLCVSPNNCY